MSDAGGRPRGKVYVKIEHVTPEDASKLLKLNTHNRDLRISRVKLLVNAIKRGEWKLNGDCVVLSGNGSGGVLLNGQHRLYAIVESGTSVDLALMYNAMPEAQETMDSGMPRSREEYQSWIADLAKEVDGLQASLARLRRDLAEAGVALRKEDA